MSEQGHAPDLSEEISSSEDGQGVIKIPREVLGVTPEGQALLEYGEQYEKELEEEGLIHP